MIDEELFSVRKLYKLKIRFFYFLKLSDLVSGREI